MKDHKLHKLWSKIKQILLSKKIQRVGFICHQGLKKTQVLPPLEADTMYPYDGFKTFQLKTYGWIFVLLSVALPIAIDGIFALTGLTGKHNYYDLIRLILRLVLDITACTTLLSQQHSKMLIKGAIGFYGFTILVTVFTFVLTLLLTVPGWKKYHNILNTLAQVISEIAVVILLFYFSPYLKNKLVRTLKNTFVDFHNGWKYLLALAITIVGALLLNYLFGVLNQLLPHANPISSNEQALDSIAKNIFGGILLGIFTILVAPVMEELAMRQGLFQLCGNKWLAYLISIIYFAQMHIAVANDWIDFIGYLGGAIALSTSFVYFRYNYVYNIIVHSALNMGAFITIYIK